MEAVYDWIKNIACYLIFMTALTNVLPSKAYEKYLRLFAGMVLLLLVFKPFTEGLRIEERIAYYFREISFAQEAAALNDQASRLENTRKERMLSRYREALAMDTAGLAEAAGFLVRRTEVSVEEDEGSENFGAVTGILMELLNRKSREGEERIPSPADIRVERIELSEEEGNRTGGTSLEEPDTGWQLEKERETSRKVNLLRRQIAGYYNLEERYVEIKMEDE